MTIIASQRVTLFGNVVDGKMILNKFGRIVSEKWQWLEIHYPYVELGAWIVMPNHFHGILAIHNDGRGGSRSAPVDDGNTIIQGDSRIAPTPIKRKPLGGLNGAFKTVSTKQINLLRNTEGQMVWQRNYYEHIIRNELEMDRISRYIETNPSQWAKDNENPSNVGP